MSYPGQNNNVSSSSGILLIEVLIAIIILAVGITTALQSFRQLVSVARASREYFEAELVGNSVLFDLYAQPNNVLDKKGSRFSFNNDDITLVSEYVVSYDWDEMDYIDVEEVEGVQTERPDYYQKVTFQIQQEDSSLFNETLALVIETNDES